MGENKFLFFNKLANRILILLFFKAIDRSGKRDGYGRKQTLAFSSGLWSSYLLSLIFVVTVMYSVFLSH